MGASNEELTTMVQALAQEVRRFGEDNVRLRAHTETGLGALPALAQAMNKLIENPEPTSRLVDNKGIGKPTSFDGTESKLREWAAKFESFVVGVYGEDFRRVMEWRLRRPTR